MGERTLITGAYVVTMDEELGEIADGQILIEDEAIAAVGTDLGVTDAELVDASGSIVVPGFVDTHRHTWQTCFRGVCADWTLRDYFRGVRQRISPNCAAEDVYAGNWVGALEALDAGVTTILDFSHCMNTPEHADAALAGLRDAGIRAMFGYGYFPAPTAETPFGEHADADRRRAPDPRERARLRRRPDHDGDRADRDRPAAVRGDAGRDRLGRRDGGPDRAPHRLLLGLAGDRGDPRARPSRAARPGSGARALQHARRAQLRPPRRGRLQDLREPGDRAADGDGPPGDRAGAGARHAAEPELRRHQLQLRRHVRPDAARPPVRAGDGQRHPHRRQPDGRDAHPHHEATRCAGARPTAPTRWGWRTGSARSRRASRPTSR